MASKLESVSMYGNMDAYLCFNMKAVTVNIICDNKYIFTYCLQLLNDKINNKRLAHKKII
jgi:hypothetical protein